MSDYDVQVDSNAPQWAQTFMIAVKSGFQLLSQEIQKGNGDLSVKFSELETKLFESVRIATEKADRTSCEVLVKQFFENHLIRGDNGDDRDVIKNMKFVRCHRLGTTDQNNKRTRPIIVRFNDFSDRQWIWGKRSLLKDTKFSVQENFAADVEYNRRKLYPIYHAARKSQEFSGKVSLNGDTLILNGNKFTVNNLEELPEEFHPRKFTYRSDESTYVFGGILSEYGSLSNYGASKFTFNDVDFVNAEQAIQYTKAVKFNDGDTAEQIRLTNDPGRAKSLGQAVSGFRRNSWNTVKGEVVLKILKAKFLQNEKCRTDLLNTGSRKLGESGTDSYFAVGLPLTHRRILDPSAWVSKNKLGTILMQVRSDLQ